ncbi:MAG: tetratricopeptide repeat protein [Nitrosospira sp.]
MALDPSTSNTGSGGIASGRSIAAGANGIAAGGDVHYHAAPGESTLRPTPPAPPAHFTGHEDDLARFAQLLTSGQDVAITALHGMGGIGKTSLALKLAGQLHPHFPGGVLWWSLGPHPDVVTALDVWVRHANPHANLSAFPTVEARVEVIRPMLAKLDKLCVFIDDVWDIGSFNILKSAVPPDCPILITTRDGDLAKSLRCRVERIDALKDDEAIEVLVKLLGSLDGEESAALDIVHLTGGLPLALELIAGIADSPSDLPTIVKQLRTKPMLEVLERGDTREQSIEVCFTMSYERLDEDLRRRFRALGVFALAPFDRDAIAAVWDDEDADTVGKAIQLLVRRSLLTRAMPSQTVAAQNDASTRSPGDASKTAVEYNQHALLRDYAVKLLSAPLASFVDVVSGGTSVGDKDFAPRHAAYYRRFAEEQNWRAIERTFDQIEWGWRWVQTHESGQIIGYLFAVQRFLDMRGRNLELLDWLDIALTQTYSAPDRKNEAVILNGLGLVYDALGRKDQALDFHRKTLAIRREVGDRSGEGATLNNLGLVYNTLGQKDQALDFHRQALAISREVSDRLGEGATLNNLGRVYDDLGQKDQAINFYQQALAISCEVANRSGEGTTLNNLGGVYDDLGQKGKALDFYRQALAILREVGNRSGEGATLNNLGRLYDNLGQKDKALDLYEQALALRREVGDRFGEGVTLSNLGLMYHALDQKDKALGFYQQSLAIRREVSDRYGEGVALLNISDLFEGMDRLEEAESVLKEAIIALKACGSPDADLAQKQLDRVRVNLKI